MCENENTLYVFGPGGPYNAIKECCETFSHLRSVDIDVVKGPPETWFNKQADLIYGGALYMLVDFAAAHPEAIDKGSISQLYERQIGIIVRKGNPLRIVALNDLVQGNVKVLDVKLEKMAEFQNRVLTMADRIYLSVTTGEQGVQAWRLKEELDAWITYKTWHYILSSETEFIPLPLEMAPFRSMPIAITAWTEKRKLAIDLILFLKNDQSQAIFQKWGWEVI